jgi:hypothetical protein
MNPPKKRLLNEEISLLMGKDDENSLAGGGLITSGDLHRKQGNSSLPLGTKENVSTVYPPRKSSLLSRKGFTTSAQLENFPLTVEDSAALKTSSKVFTSSVDSLSGFTSIGRKVISPRPIRRGLGDSGNLTRRSGRWFSEMTLAWRILVVWHYAV